MCGAHRTMISPSSSRTRRSTPWVLGCWGPILMVMVRRSVTGRPLFPPFRRGLHRVVLPERESLPRFRHEDPPEIGMALKANAEHIEYFTLVPIGGTPDGRDAGHRFTFLNVYLEPDSQLVLKGIEMVDHLKAGVVSKPINCGEIRSEEHTSELQSPLNLVCRLLLEKKK